MFNLLAGSNLLLPRAAPWGGRHVLNVDRTADQLLYGRHLLSQKQLADVISIIPHFNIPEGNKNRDRRRDPRNNKTNAKGS